MSGVTVAWKLGRDAADNPEAFARSSWAALALAAAILLIGRIAEAPSRSATAAPCCAAIASTLVAWWLVQRWGLHHLYELVPAFFLAAGAAVTVSLLFPGETGNGRRKTDDGKLET